MKTNPTRTRGRASPSTLTAIAAAVIALLALPAIAAIGDIEEGGLANSLFLVQVVVIIVGLVATGLTLRDWRRRRALPPRPQ